MSPSVMMIAAWKVLRFQAHEAKGFPRERKITEEIMTNWQKMGFADREEASDFCSALFASNTTARIPVDVEA